MINSAHGRNYGPGDNHEESKAYCPGPVRDGTRNNRDGRGWRQADYRNPAAGTGSRGPAVLSSMHATVSWRELPGLEVRGKTAAGPGWIRENRLYRATRLRSRIGIHPNPDNFPEGVSLC